MKIAILLDHYGRATRLSEGGTLYVYERRENTASPSDLDVWSADRKFDFAPGGCNSMAELRSYLGSVVRWMEDCRVLAAKLSNGYYRVVFEGNGVGLWAVSGLPPDFVTKIEAFYQNCPTRETSGEKREFIVPIPNKTGFYSADLRDVMAHKTSLNSREVLLPFLQNTPFNRLEIICDHVPRWFEKELPYLHLRADIESSSKYVKIHVYRE